jgi:inosine/xanthosine triphosphatase
MKNIIVASQNPVKSQAVFAAFNRAYPSEDFTLKSYAAASGVSDQPMSNAEALEGAYNRIMNVRQSFPNADFWVGIEGGVEEEYGMMTSFAWICIYNGTTWGKARSGTFVLPAPLADLVRQGKELGDADDIIFKRTNSKQSNGAVGILTNNRMDRTELYEHAMLLALIPFLQPEFLNQS